MDQSTVSVAFSVVAWTEPSECVCLTGDDVTLGTWDPLRMVKMTRGSVTGESSLWTTTVPLTPTKKYHYRFVVCKDSYDPKPCESTNQTSNGNNGHHKSQAASEAASSREKSSPMTIYKWETGVKPRVLSLEDQGECFTLPQATFGIYGGETNVGGGWLVNQSEVRVRVHSQPINMWKAKYRDQTYSIKCTAVDYSEQESKMHEEDEESRDSPPLRKHNDVYACNLNNHSNCQPSSQGPAGLVYSYNDYLVFSTQAEDPYTTGFQLDIYVHEANKAPRFVGSSHLLPPKPNESHTKHTVAIIGCTHRPIGEISVEMLTATPVPGLEMGLDLSYQTYQTSWKKKDPEKGLETSLDIGHRGMGASYSRFNALKENTVASFAAAASHGADFVEFDVLLSKDKVPVIYHDFEVKVLYSHKENTKESEMFEVPVPKLSLAQLQSMRLFSGEQNVEINTEGECERHDPFPTLEQVLTSVDSGLGYNVEIKYPQQLADETWEAENFVDRNENLDIILPVVFAHAGSRKIVFSTFDPDTATLLKLKQNKYPVMFLSQGETNIYPSFKDVRNSTFQWAINFALSERLLGVVLHAEVLLRDVSLLQRCYDNNMVVFVWGNDNNDPHVIRKMRELNVHGVIYDRIDCHKPEHQGPEFELSSAKDAASIKKAAGK